MSGPTIADALAIAVQTLQNAGVDGAARDARRLMAHVLGIDAGMVTLRLRDETTPEVQARFDALIARRAAREPVSHIIGTRAFYGRDFAVTRDVLDPRPDTETLIGVALEEPFDRVLDLGTGSGAILISLLAERPGAQGVATDISPAALEVAKANALALDVAERAAFIRSDWYAEVDGPFDLIVSNPPYIAAVEMDGLQPEVREHEPRIALTDEGDGLSCYRAIAEGAPAHLTPGGRLIVEIGPTQAADVARIFTTAGLDVMGVRTDLDGRDRVILAKLTL